MLKPQPDMHHTRCSSRFRGYTLVEVLLVVAILGIVSAAVVPSMLSAGTMGVQAAARIIVADLLYAQNEAVAQQAQRGIVFDVSSNSYRLIDADGKTLSADWLSGKASNDDKGNYIVDFTKDARFQGVTIVSAAFDEGQTVTYDALGSPSTGGSIELRYGSAAYRIAVSSFTGRVTVERLGS